MCGVLGIFGKTLTSEIVQMLSLLTHRGQDAAGIAWIDNKNQCQITKVNDHPEMIDCPLDQTNCAIGSTRYPTYGTRISNGLGVEHFAQPFLSPKKSLISVHNGQLTNIQQLMPQGHFLSDAEFICTYLESLFDQYGTDYPSAIAKLMQDFDGSFSEVVIVNTSPNPKLLAFRDPLGIRPLILGKVQERYVVCSESVVLEQMGGKIIRDIKPGELIILSYKNNDIIIDNYQLTQTTEVKHCMFEYVYFASPASVIDKKIVYDVRMKLGEALAKEIQKRDIKIDYIVPVPDSSRIAAQRVAEVLNVPMREVILKNRYQTTRTFILNSDHERNKALNTKYIYVHPLITDKVLMIIDDSIVRGNTAKKIIHQLKMLGAKKVIFAATCPPIIRPCYYGIDMAVDSDLIAKDRSLNEIQETLGADMIIYQGIGDLYEAIGTQSLCTACITGDYPTKVGKDLRKLLGEGKINPNYPHYEQVYEVN